MYVSVVCEKDPTRIADLMGYLDLIVKARMEYSGDSWLGYNCCFHQ